MEKFSEKSCSPELFQVSPPRPEPAPLHEGPETPKTSRTLSGDTRHKRKGRQESVFAHPFPISAGTGGKTERISLPCSPSGVSSLRPSSRIRRPGSGCQGQGILRTAFQFRRILPFSVRFRKFRSGSLPSGRRETDFFVFQVIRKKMPSPHGPATFLPALFFPARFRTRRGRLPRSVRQNHVKPENLKKQQSPAGKTPCGALPDQAGRGDWI